MLISHQIKPIHQSTVRFTYSLSQYYSLANAHTDSFGHHNPTSGIRIINMLNVYYHNYNGHRPSQRMNHSISFEQFIKWKWIWIIRSAHWRIQIAPSERVCTHSARQQAVHIHIHRIRNRPQSQVVWRGLTKSDTINKIDDVIDAVMDLLLHTSKQKKRQ